MVHSLAAASSWLRSGDILPNILLRIIFELLLACRTAEIKILAFVLGLTNGICRVHVHAAHGIFNSHDGFHCHLFLYALPFVEHVEGRSSARTARPIRDVSRATTREIPGTDRTWSLDQEPSSGTMQDQPAGVPPLDVEKARLRFMLERRSCRCHHYSVRHWFYSSGKLIAGRNRNDLRSGSRAIKLRLSCARENLRMLLAALRHQLKPAEKRK